MKTVFGYFLGIICIVIGIELFLVIAKLNFIAEYLSAFNNAGIYQRHHAKETSDLVSQIFKWVVSIIILLKLKTFSKLETILTNLYNSFIWNIQTISLPVFLSFPWNTFPEKNNINREDLIVSSFHSLLFQCMKISQSMKIFSGNFELIGTQSQFNDTKIALQNYISKLSDISQEILPEEKNKAIQDRKSYFTNVFGIEGDKRHAHIVQISFLSLTTSPWRDQQKIAADLLIEILVRQYGISFEELSVQQLQTISKGIELILGAQVDNQLNEVLLKNDPKIIKTEWSKIINTLLKKI
jgi:hypothetical protein